MAKIAKSLTNLLKDHVSFKGGRDAQKSFNKLKTILCTEPLLTFPNIDLPFVVTCDSSDFALGAVLSHCPIGSDRPIAYMHHKLLMPLKVIIPL